MSDNPTTAQQQSTSEGDGKNTTTNAGQDTQPAQNGGTKITFTDEQQQHINNLISGKFAEWQRKADADKQTAAEKAKQQALKEQGDWKSIAEQHEARIKALEPVESQATRYRDLLNSQIDAEIKAWPKEVAALDPGTDNLDARLAFVQKSRALAAALQAKPPAPDTEVGRRSERRETATATEQQQQRYRFQHETDVKW